MNKLVLPAVLSICLSASLTYAIIYVSRRWGKLLAPQKDRWHKKPTPGFGGIAIFVSFTGLCLAFCSSLHNMLPVIGGGAAVFLIGFIDDIFDVRPYTRLLLEIGVACTMIMSGIHIIFQSNPIIFIPLTILWIVGITNAFNLLDNMDGLASGIGAITSLFLLIISIKLGLNELIIPTLILAGSLFGFLIFNFNPAKIFLGDCGALYIGFILSVLSIQGTWHQASNLFLMLLTPLLILGIPIFDTAFVTLQRKLHGLPVTQGGKDHSSHRLVMMGWSEKRAILFLYALAFILGIIAIVGLDYNVYVKSVGFAITIITVVLFGLFLSQTKVYSDDGINVKVNGTVKILDNVLYKRRILDILIDSTLIIVAYISAYLIKYDGEISGYNFKLINQSLPLILIIKLASLYLSGIYKGVWKYIDFDDAMKIVKGALMGSVGTIVVLLGFTRFSGYSRSLFVIDFILLIFLLSGSRILLRVMRESFYSYPKAGKNILIVGAGEGGRLALSEIRKNRHMNFKPVCILDDDAAKHGKSLMGIPVLCGTNEIQRILEEKQIEKVLVTIPSAPKDKKEMIAQLCDQAGVECKIMKSFEEIF